MQGNAYQAAHVEMHGMFEREIERRNTQMAK
jgi:hypothetical protein